MFGGGVDSNTPLPPQSTSSMFDNNFSGLNNIPISHDLGVEDFRWSENPIYLDDIDEEEGLEVLGATGTDKQKLK